MYSGTDQYLRGLPIKQSSIVVSEVSKLKDYSTGVVLPMEFNPVTIVCRGRKLRSFCQKGLQYITKIVRVQWLCWTSRSPEAKGKVHHGRFDFNNLCREAIPRVLQCTSALDEKICIRRPTADKLDPRFTPKCCSFSFIRARILSLRNSEICENNWFFGYHQTMTGWSAELWS